MTKGISKKAYAEYQVALLQHFVQCAQPVDPHQQVHAVLQLFCSIMHFDPNASTYTPNQASAIKQFRERQLVNGVSTYVSSGSKSTYHKNKALMTRPSPP